jgi:hypothetical protein
MMQATTSLSLTHLVMTCLLGPFRFLTKSQRLTRGESLVAGDHVRPLWVGAEMCGSRGACHPRRDHRPSDCFWFPWHRHGGEESQAVCRR